MRLHQYSWPGNVRELGNVVERAVAHSLIQNPNLKAHQIEVRHLPDHLRDDAVLGIDGDSLGFTGGQPISIKLGTPLRKVEDLLIRKTLEATHGDKALAAKLLGVNSRTIYRRLERDKDQS